MLQEMNPHELLSAYVADRLGNGVDAFGAAREDLFTPLVLGLTEQLSIYVDVITGARLRVRYVYLRLGSDRAYLMADVRDCGRPLRLREATERWKLDLDSDRPNEMVWRVNARRWRFIDQQFRTVLEPLIRGFVGLLAEYYARRPGAIPQVGLMRILEDVDATLVCVEIDDRCEELEPGTPDSLSRYRVQ